MRPPPSSNLVSIFFKFGANIAILSGVRAPKKNQVFLVKIFQKVPKNAFFGLFFEKFACEAENFWQNWVLVVPP